MNLKRNQDSKAAEIRFGIEIETTIPATSGVEVGHYHNGTAVTTGKDATTGEIITAPSFEGNYWKAERDGSIRAVNGQMACEFVSPILHGEAGLAALAEFIKFANRIGAKPNKTCGCHVTVGLTSIVGTDVARQAEFCKKVARYTVRHQTAVYAQTGTNRHENRYSLPLEPLHQAAVDAFTATAYGNRAGRGIVNFSKAFGHGERNCIEFRAFAGTLNAAKVFHHVATVFGLCRKAAESTFNLGWKSSVAKKPVTNATTALRKMWKTLGWDGIGNSESLPAYGLFGSLHANIEQYGKEALRMAKKWQTKFPTVAQTMSGVQTQNQN